MSARECEQCGAELDSLHQRFCSRTCQMDWLHDPDNRAVMGPKPSLEEMRAEMAGVFERLRTYPEESP